MMFTYGMAMVLCNFLSPYARATSDTERLKVRQSRLDTPLNGHEAAPVDILLSMKPEYS